MKAKIGGEVPFLGGHCPLVRETLQGQKHVNPNALL